MTLDRDHDWQTRLLGALIWFVMSLALSIEICTLIGWADTEAIREAASRPTMRFVPVQSEGTEGPAGLRIHLQDLDFRTRQIHHHPNRPEAGTEHLTYKARR